MAHKTFISYKYSEAQNLRDRLINCLGEDSIYYKGETSESPDLTDKKTETIKATLADMIYDTSVTIVIISPHMKESKWIEWEIAYSLKSISRKGRTSKTNGILGVIMKCNDSCDWFRTLIWRYGRMEPFFQEYLVCELIRANRFNHKNLRPSKNSSSEDDQDISYISYVTEDSFIKDPNYYINKAFEKSQHTDNYDITKEQKKHR
jgi:hypothetical protein